MTWVGLQYVIEVFPDQTHLLFHKEKFPCLYTGFLVARFEVIATDKKKQLAKNSHTVHTYFVVTNIFHTITQSLYGIIETGFSMKFFDKLGQCK